MSDTGPKTEAGKMVVSQNLNPTAWTQNPNAVQAIEVAKRLRNTKHGLYASVPIICKSNGCPYKDSCQLHQMELAPHGEKCPIEIAAIEDLFDRYITALKIDRDDPGNTVDLIMVKEVVDLDIQMLRCDNKMAIDADFIIENTISVNEDGDAMTRSELHPAVEYKQKLLASKHKTLQLLNSTRKDKEGNKTTFVLDASQRAAELIKTQQDMKKLEDDEDEAEQAYYRRMAGNNTPTIIDVEPIGFDEK
ncbi:hypothetical protein SAMN02799624_05230 [Paenibacillus sp. UNC496MF]|uniref:hypothetical protein n=1 Tax=Paenibacillus sp. UNC496MF TaxID=1502753 RepID=UPI0008E0C826|nr:hypothetical protein [Paenibacillus sp. UNC496MF]SFJ62558.1 hypothetical protein SAMN02799624_05230 [Paenibacillus sp. UNC496MF]